MRRTASTYKPDPNLEGVCPLDIMDQTIESRHIGDNEILPLKMATVENNIAVPFVITKDITTGAASVKLMDANAPFKFRIIDVIIEPAGASTNGTMKITDGTSDITDAIVCAVDKTVARAGTIDNAKSTIAKGGSVVVVCAGDAVASTIGNVSIVCVKVD